MPIIKYTLWTLTCPSKCDFDLVGSSVNPWDNYDLLHHVYFTYVANTKCYGRKEGGHSCDKQCGVLEVKACFEKLLQDVLQGK